MSRYLLLAATVLGVLLAACTPAAAIPPPQSTASGELPTVEPIVTPTTSAAQAPLIVATPEANTDRLPDHIRAAHFVDSVPSHGEIFAMTPGRVLINFDFTLGENSQISVTREGTAVNASQTEIAANKLSMSVNLVPNAGDGTYLVKYKACWPDRSCHDGQFAFKVDEKTKSSYVAMTGQSEVSIHLKGIRFEPSRIVISRGTKVNWINDDPVVHFVNTDPHPNHNALPGLNSLEIKQGEGYSFTFDQPGEWAYHCSAHVPQNMLGRVIVLEQPGTPKPTETARAASSSTPLPVASPTVTPAAATRKKVSVESLPPQLFSPHFVLSNPEHGDLLSKLPGKIRIEFNFNLHPISNITVTRDGKNIDVVKEVGPLSIETTPPSNAGSGLYLVSYKACWPDRSCHEGQFAFKVDPSQ